MIWCLNPGRDATLFSFPTVSDRLWNPRGADVTGQAAMSVSRNIEARSCNHCCSGRAMSITESECVFVALGIQHAMHMRHILICGLPHSRIVFLNRRAAARYRPWHQLYRAARGLRKLQYATKFH
jgi:hypothetical protein